MPRLKRATDTVDVGSDDEDPDVRLVIHAHQRRIDGRLSSPRRRLRGDSRDVSTAGKRCRADNNESFKCQRCKAFIGPTVSGGRHRNHCPLCLYSKPVNAKTLCDRASTCRSLMAPVGVFYRAKGEQVLLHRCLGCGLERHNRIAADDNPVALLRLPLVTPRFSRDSRVLSVTAVTPPGGESSLIGLTCADAEDLSAD